MSGMMFDSFDQLHCKKHLLALVCVCVFSRATLAVVIELQMCVTHLWWHIFDDTALMTQLWFFLQTWKASPQMEAWRTSSDVVRLNWNMVEFPCLQQWVILPQRSPGNFLVIFRLRPAWNSLTCPMVWRPFPKCQPQDGDKFWHTWPSARFLRISLLELQPQQETLDSRSWHHLILRRRPRNWAQSWRTAALQWWPSLACSFRTFQQVKHA